MKLNLFETHDRLLHFTKQTTDISECCQNLVDQRPFGEHPFYIFSHARTLDEAERLKLFMSGQYALYENVPSKTIVWQPRLTKPKAQTNSMLFKAYPGTDIIKVIWMIPDRALWGQYAQGLVTANKTVQDSIEDFQHDRQKLEKKEDDDLNDEQIDAIYMNIARAAKAKKHASTVEKTV